MSFRPISPPCPRQLVEALPVYSRASSRGIRWRASSNEAAGPASPRALRAAMDAAGSAHLYPDPGGEALTEAVAAHLGLDTDTVAVGAGSLALLERLLLAYTGPGTEVVHAWRSYEAYPIVVAIAGATSVPVPLDDGYRHDVDGMLSAITPRTRVLIVCNPNNPTGTVVAPSELERLISSVPDRVLVVLDEAYREFDDEPPDTPALLAEHPNLVLLRTFSKAYALAGLRAGHLVAAPSVVAALRRVALPFAVNRVAEAAAVAALEDREHLQLVVGLARASRARLHAALDPLVSSPASRANFLWLPTGQRTMELADACAELGVSVRAFPGEGLRVTVGHEAVERALISATSSVVAATAAPGRPVRRA